MNSEDCAQVARPPKTINPYLFAAGLVLSRLKWDFKIESWKSRKRLRQLKDTHFNQKAVILCNGPSLLKVDFDLLSKSGVYCFGLNKINLLFKDVEFRPSSIVAVNPFVIDQNLEFFNRTELPLFLDSYGAGRVKNSQATFLHSSSIVKFAEDCSTSIYQGHTVTYVALQLAYHMGFREVAIVGADHNFAVKGPPNKTVISGEVDHSHFDPTYFSGGMKWQLPDLFQSEIAYTMARDAFSSGGGRVVNATEGGQLEVFERQSLESFLK